MLRGSLAALALASVAVACDGTPTTPTSPSDARPLSDLPLAASTSGPSVTGAGTITFGASEEHVSVNVFGTSGHAVFHDKAAGGTFNGQIDINCVRIVGNEATLSGIVTHSNDESLEGFEALFQIRDNGDGRKGSVPDVMSPILFHAVGTGPDCLIPGEFDLAPVKGDFKVQP
jgi:hypothetical protein